MGGQLDVFFTVDVEVWCDGWDDLDRKFPGAYRKYVYGPTRQGNYGLPATLQFLNDHGLLGVFFVEPLFATRFGVEPLRELVGLIREGGQEVQLHLHTEWVNEGMPPLLPGVTGKRQHMRHFTRAEQDLLVKAGLDLLREAGAGPINAFRAGNWGMNRDTLDAVAANSLRFDSSYNAASKVGVDNVAPGRLLTQPATFGTVTEIPVTVFRDRGPSRLRSLQLTACSFREMARILDTTADSGWASVTIVSHNFELLNRRKDRPDPLVVRRLRRLCHHLERNTDRFRVRGFRDLDGLTERVQPEPPRSPAWLTCERVAEQLVRRAWR